MKFKNKGRKIYKTKEKNYYGKSPVGKAFSVGLTVLLIGGIGFIGYSVAEIGLYSPLLWSMYADVADYATEKNGTSSTGLIFSSGTMAQKFGSAVSGSLVALFLGFAGFISGTDALTGETVVTITDLPAVQSMIWAIFSLFPAVMALVILLLLKLYPIKK